MQLVFLRYNRLWSVFIPVLGELVLILYLTGLKLHFDGDAGSEGVSPPPAAEGALINLGSGGDAEICVNAQPEEESGGRVLVFPGSCLEPLLGDEGQGRPAEVRHEGARLILANTRTNMSLHVQTMKQHATAPAVQMFPLVLRVLQVPGKLFRAKRVAIMYHCPNH